MKSSSSDILKRVLGQKVCEKSVDGWGRVVVVSRGCWRSCGWQIVRAASAFAIAAPVPHCHDHLKVATNSPKEYDASVDEVELSIHTERKYSA